MLNESTRRFPYLQWAIMVMLINVLALLSILSAHTMTVSDLLALGHRAAVIGLVAVGVMVVFYVNDYDLSVGSVFALSLFGAVFLEAWTATSVAWCVVLGVVCLIGFANGWLAVRVRSGLLTTFVMLFTIQGVLHLLNRGLPISHAEYAADSLMHRLGWQSLGGVPLSAWLFLGMALTLHQVFFRTAWGRSLRAIGLDSQAAAASGVCLQTYTIGAYVFSAAMAGAASLIYSARLQTVSPDLEVSIPFDALAIVIMSNGGTSRCAPSLVRLVLATLLLSGIHMKLDILGILPDVGFLVVGGLILSTLLLQTFGDDGSVRMAQTARDEEDNTGE